MVSGQAGLVKGRFDVRFGSKADMCSAKGHVRFTPNSDRKSGHPQNAMSAVPLKADVRRKPLCPLWVISGHMQCNRQCPLYPR